MGISQKFLLGPGVQNNIAGAQQADLFNTQPQAPMQPAQQQSPAPKPIALPRTANSISTQQQPQKTTNTLQQTNTQQGMGTVNGPTVGQQPGQFEFTKQQQANTANTQVTNKTTQAAEQAPAAPVVPKVTEERGKWTTDRDPTTNIVYDKDANNKPEAAIAHTYTDEQGGVHYTGKNPDGSPSAPWLDTKGWQALSPEQQKAAAQDFVTQQTEFAKKEQDKSNPMLNPDQWAQLDANGKLAAAQSFLDGKQKEDDEAKAKADAADKAKADEEAKATVPKTVVDRTGRVSYSRYDANGQAQAPWVDAAGWSKLTPEQQQAAKAQYAQDIEAAAQKQQQANPNGAVDPSKIDPDEWAAMSPQDQAAALRGQKPPQANVDGSFTYTNNDGSTQTKDAKGNVTAEVAADGTKTNYGTDGTKVVVSADGTATTTTDSSGHTTTKYAKDSPQDKQMKAGFNVDGSKMSTQDLYFYQAGIDPAKATQADITKYQRQMAVDSISNWAQGEAYARAAVQAGLLSQQDYMAMNAAARNDVGKPNYARSFGTWLANNRDIARALDNSGAVVAPSDGAFAKAAATYATQNQAQILQNMDQFYSDNSDAYFNQMRGKNAQTAGYVDPSALANIQFGAQLTAKQLPGAYAFI